MSSFHKTVDAVTVPGTKSKNNLLTVSSGIPSLDHIIGGGLPTGSVFLVEEDVLGNYSRVLSKYFLSEGVVCKHSLLIASADEEPQTIVKELPAPCESPPPDEVSNNTASLDKMKIAWRYEGLQQVESSFGSNSNFGHHFDLSKTISSEAIEDCNISYWQPQKQNSLCNGQGFKNTMYLDLLKYINQSVTKDEHQSSTKCKKNILRISIQSVGSPMWLALESDSDQSSAEDLIKFIYCLRIIIRESNAVAFITVPAHLLEDETVVKRVRYSADNAVKFESFAGSSRETNPVFKDYHGLFHITKISAVNSLVPYIPPAVDLAFKLRRKKFIIEKLHLPPELQESSEREQDDITAVPKACGGFKKKDIDF